mgnify:CR=1 FL=1
MVDSKEGAGTTVTIVLPYVKSEPKSEVVELIQQPIERKETENE